MGRRFTRLIDPDGSLDAEVVRARMLAVAVLAAAALVFGVAVLRVSAELGDGDTAVPSRTNGAPAASSSDRLVADAPARLRTQQRR